MILGCLTHWYVSLLYVVPVAAVGGWGWWSAKRMSKNRRRPGGDGTPKLDAAGQ